MYYTPYGDRFLTEDRLNPRDRHTDSNQPRRNLESIFHKLSWG